MDSINKNQPEDNHKDLFGQEGIEKLKVLVEKAETCFFCTEIGPDGFATRPMAVQKVDESGNIWFLSAVDSHKNKEIKQDSFVQALFQGSPHSDFLTVKGHATISKDKNKIKEFWNPMLKTWFTEGEDDPRITVIKLAPFDAYYWDTKHGTMISFIKRLAGAVVGKTLDDSVEGKIKVKSY